MSSSGPTIQQQWDGHLCSLDQPQDSDVGQLEHTQTNLTQLEEEIDKLLEADKGSKGLQSVPEFGRKTVAVLRAELGEVTRFQRADQVVAYAGLDLEVKESGKWKGQVKLSKRGSGRLRRILSSFRRALHPAGRLGLWCLLPPPGRSRHEKA